MERHERTHIMVTETMTAQMPAEGILKRSDWGDAMTYQVVCQCSDPNHDHSIWVESSDDIVSVSISTRLSSHWQQRSRWYYMWQLLTRGSIEVDESIILTEQQALNYAETLKLAVGDVQKFKKGKNELSIYK